MERCTAEREDTDAIPGVGPIATEEEGATFAQ